MLKGRWFPGFQLALVFVALTSRAVEPQSESWFAVCPPGAQTTTLTNSGIPFLRFASVNLTEGKTAEFPLHGMVATRLLFLGMTNSPDVMHPAWGGGDSRVNFFIGDLAGQIVLKYESGREDKTPLVFGYTLGWRNSYRISPAPFASDAGARKRLEKALCVINGVEAYRKDEPMWLCVLPRPEPLRSVCITDSTNKAGFVGIEGITLSGADGSLTNEFLWGMGPVKLAESIASLLASNGVKAADPFPKSRMEAVEDLRAWLYTRPSDLTAAKVKEAAMTLPALAAGLPEIQFRGAVEAEILTHIYRENAIELLTRVETNGLFRESNLKADNYNGFGGYTAGFGAFRNAFYTRNRGPIVLANLGQRERTESALDFYNKALMYFPESYPKLQLGGKPVPGHATVIANTPHVYFDELRRVGWATKYTTRDMGNPETDGHGFMMLSHYVAWVKACRSRDWIRQRWAAINEAAEFIPWQLDNPDLSFSEHGLLYAESEGGMLTESLYCNVPCWLGLLAFADMADAAGESAKAGRWRAYADKLLAAMNAWFSKEHPQFGRVWDPEKTAKWGYGITALAPVLFGLDYWGLDMRESLPSGWPAQADRTWKMAVTDMKPKWCAPSGFGYGQAYYTIAGLLLDRTAEASKIVDWTARMIFAPGQPHPFRVPEGVVMATDGAVWRRWGDLGNGYQMCAVLRAIQVMAGVDDLSASELRLIPRIPLHWQSVSVTNYPVTTRSSGALRAGHVDFAFERVDHGSRMRFLIRPDMPLDRVRLRVGPIPSKVREFKVALDGKPIPARRQVRGDADWLWISLENVAAQAHTILIRN